jgi:TonB-linked SusC/RagA family outer membrane protein
MKKSLLWLLLLLSGMLTEAWAQNRIIGGTVTDRGTGQGLPGVTIIVKGRPTIGTSTNSDGVYSLTVPQDAGTLVFSFVGYTAQELPVATSTTLNVALAPDSKQLNEVVVTALGLQANRDQLGTAQATVQGPALVRSGETSVINALSGKTPGVTITRTSGDPGASANIQLRGPSTILGNNQPLIVVDGVPISNSSIGDDGIVSSNGGAGSNQVSGVVQASRLNDINPDDIATLEVLKGAAASAVWGTRGSNGVIVITTKRGSSAAGRMNASIRSSISIDQINRRVPLQTAYGQGLNGSYNNTNSASWGDLISSRSGGADTYVTAANQFYRRSTNPDGSFSFTDLYQGYLTLADGTRVYNIPSAGDFAADKTTRLGVHGGKNSQQVYDHSQDAFNNGYTWDNIATLSGGDERSNVYFSLGDTYQKGIARVHSDNERITARLNADRQLTDKLRIALNTTYVRTLSNRVQQGSNTDGIFLGGLRTSPDYNNDVSQGDYTSPNGFVFTGRQAAYRNKLGSTTNPGYDNPIWTINNVRNQTRVNRFVGSLELNYQVTPWLNILERAGVDTYADARSSYFPIGAAGVTSNVGSITEEVIQETQVNNDIIVRATGKLGSAVTITGLVGYNLNARRQSQVGATATKFLNPLSPPQLGNTPAANRSPYNLLVRQNTAGLYGQVSLGFFDQLFVEGTVRGEQASTFGPEANNTFFYPAGTVAWQFTKLAALSDNTFLSFGKARFAYGQVGVQPQPYLVKTVYVPGGNSDGWGTSLSGAAYADGAYARSSTQGNPLLRPERKTEYELGLDMRFVQNRIGFSATYYSNNTRDAIFALPTSPTTGYSIRYSNAASLMNRGLELSLDGEVIKTKDFSFTVSPNFSLNRSRVLSLGGATYYGLTGFTGSESVAIPGYQYGALYGTRWQRDEQGKLVLDANGFAQQDAQSGVIGDPNPRWKGGLNLNFRIKGVTINALLDHTHGADIWNGTKGALAYFGTAAYTGQQTTVTADQARTTINYDGNTIANTYAPNSDGSYTFRGYLQDFGGGQRAIDQAWFRNGPGSGFTGPSEQFVEHVSWTRLREVSVNYSLASEGVRKITHLSSIDLSVTGRNLVLWTNYSGIDPETNLTGVSNGRGLDYFNNPSTRSIIFAIKLTY